MHKESLGGYEQIPPFEIVPPAVESLLHYDRQDSPWPEEIKENAQLQKEADERTYLEHSLSSLFDLIGPENGSLEQALESNLMSPEQGTALLEKMASFLESDPGNKRLLLYMPFELIPSASCTTTSVTLQQAITRFQDTYINTWYELLSTNDVRANFVDGDILEIELRTQPLVRVTKAAHLIPILAEKGLISISEITKIMSDNPGTVLEKSIAETIPVLADMGIISKEDLEHIKTNYHVELEQKEIPEEGKMTEARERWKEETEKKRKWDTSARTIAQEILSNKVGPGQIDGSNIEHIIAIRHAIELTVKDTRSKADQLYDRYKDILAEAWNNKSPETQNELTTTFAYLVQRKIIDKTTVESMGIRIPSLDGSTVDDKENMQDETREFERLVQAIEHDPELSKYVFPATILFGSRIKGYGTENADIDYAVFIKPNTEEHDRAHIQELLKKATGDRIHGKPVECWLEEQESVWNIKNFTHPDGSLADSSWAHVLFEGAWYGNKETIKTLHEKLLTGYLYSEGKKEGKRDAREIWLQEMEKDTLQYRLLHKGYARYFPEEKGLHTEHSDLIDANNSRFYDSGYRRLATKLFLEKVFLPQLKK